MKRFVVILAVLLLGVLFLLLFGENKYFEKQTVTDNPAAGFAPSASYTSAAQNEQLVYAEIRWSDFEPAEGEYDFASLESKYNFDTWRKAGKHLVLRFVCDVPSSDAHMDIPQWLYDKTQDGEYYDISYGKGYAPDYSNEYVIAAHARAIAALGEYMSRDNFCLYVELGSLGHWGEWHVKTGEGLPPIPNEDICEQYVKPYVDSFKTAKLLMRRPFSFVEKYGMGVYNDMTGEAESTNEWLDWIKNGGIYEQSIIPQTLAAMPNIYDTAPVGGEFTSSIPLETMLGEDLNKTLALIKASRMTFIGPMCPHSETNQDANAVAQIKAQLGYQYRVSKLNKRGDKYTLTLVNDGAAPLYWDWDVYLYSLNANGEIVGAQKLDVKLSQLTSGKKINVTAKIDGDTIGIGVVDPLTNAPAVEFSMNCRKTGKISVIYEK